MKRKSFKSVFQLGRSWAIASLLIYAALGLMFPRILKAEVDHSVVGCGCPCGIKPLPPPCSEQACKRACGYQEPSPGPHGSSSNEEAERQKKLEEQKKQEEAEEQRQWEEQKKKAAEAEKQRQEEFARKKEELLKSMKGIGVNELGLKGIGESGGLGLKGVESPPVPVKPVVSAPAATKGAVPKAGPEKCGENCRGAYVSDLLNKTIYAVMKQEECAQTPIFDSSVVDLRCLDLDPDRPIYIDFKVVKGKERTIPAQASMKTLNNLNYQQGFKALINHDPEAAIAFFNKAQAERPGDLSVKNALLLAGDLQRVKAKKDADARYVQAREIADQGLDALVYGDRTEALYLFRKASALNPDDQGLRDIVNFVEANGRARSKPTPTISREKQP